MKESSELNKVQNKIMNSTSKFFVYLGSSVLTKFWLPSYSLKPDRLEVFKKK